MAEVEQSWQGIQAQAIRENGPKGVAKDLRLEGPGGLQVEAYRTQEPIIPSIGYGGHPVAARPKRKALTVWQGRQPFQITVPMLLWEKNESVEPERRTLDEMATGTDAKEPISVKFYGEALPIPPTVANNWWIETITWGEEVRRRRDWAMIRKQVTITLLERVDDELLAQSTLAARVAGNTKTIAKHYTVQARDTLSSIAARELLNANRWIEIAELNGIRSNGELHAGMKLVLP